MRNLKRIQLKAQAEKVNIIGMEQKEWKKE